MPASEVMHKWAAGELHSGSKTGPVVKNKKQAIAIKISEQKKADEGDTEYQDHPERQLARGAKFRGHR